MLDLTPEFRFSCQNLEYIDGMSIDWITKQPLDEPKCGFNNDRCGYSWEFITAIVCFCSLMTVALAFVIRFVFLPSSYSCTLTSEMRSAASVHLYVKV